MIKYLKKLIEFFFSIFNLAIFRTSGPIRTQLYKQFFEKLKIFDTGHKLIRVGPESDGGYVLPDILDQIDYCFSPGVGHTCEFEKQISAKNIECFLADKSIDSPPDKNFKFNFIKKNLNSFTDNSNITLDFWVNNYTKDNSNLLLQMDIEGGEIDVILSSSIETLNKFKIILIEFHDFDFLKTMFGIRILSNVFNKLNKNFSICHIHPNNCCGYTRFANYKIPKVMEFTLIRNDLIIDKKKTLNKLPLEIDKKNYPNKKEVYLSDIFF